MTWHQVKAQIIANMHRGLDLDPNCQYKIVDDIPPYQCCRNGFNGEEGYRIQIGRNDFIDVPFSMLELIHQTSINQAAGYYSRKVFNHVYSHLLSSKPCYVHAVGKIFLLSNTATQINDTLYKFS